MSLIRMWPDDKSAKIGHARIELANAREAECYHNREAEKARKEIIRLAGKLKQIR